MHQHFSPVPEYSPTFWNRCFLLRTDHWLYTREHALSVGLSYSWWSMIRSMNSCGSLDMMVVVVQEAFFFHLNRRA